MRYHCKYCDREGHLEEFCFRRKRAVRREQERRTRTCTLLGCMVLLGVVVGKMLGLAV